MRRARGDLHAFIFVERETLGGNLDHIFARRQAAFVEYSVMIRGGGERISLRRGDQNCGSPHRRARRVPDLAMKAAGAGLGECGGGAKKAKEKYDGCPKITALASRLHSVS